MSSEGFCLWYNIVMAERYIFHPDRITFRGPRVDGSFVISFEIGEYEYDAVKDIPKFNGTMVTVEVTSDDAKGG